MEISERLKMVLTMHKLSPSAFADRIGVQRSSVSHVLSGRNKPGLDFLEKILTHFPRVNAAWLITGEVKEEEEQAKAIFEDEARAPYGNQITDQPFKKAETSTSEERLNADSAIERIVIFYKDGTFETFKNK